MFLLIGLGNPGRAYEQHRHNLGRAFLIDLAARENLVWKRDTFGDWVRCRSSILFLPRSFMNESGHDVAKVAHFFKIPVQNFCVFHDELERPLGYFGAKQGGSARGHNGLRSIMACCGSEFWRLAIGIDHPKKVAPMRAVHQYVLSDLSPLERAQYHAVQASVLMHGDLLLQGDFEAFALALRRMKA